MAWDAATIGALYGVDTNAATAMRALMMGPIYGTTADSFVPGFLMSSFGTTPYLTQSFNNWLLGWHDPVSAFLATGNPMDMTVGGPRSKPTRPTSAPAALPTATARTTPCVRVRLAIATKARPLPKTVQPNSPGATTP